jgi:hypothetical protein
VSSRNVGVILTIAALLAITIAFGFGLLPAGIALGYGSDGAGLSPRFIPQLATAGIALALAFGLFQAVASKAPAEDASLATGDHPLRAASAALICLLSAYLGFALLGFYLGGAIMSAALMLLLGERRPLVVIVFPLLVLVVVYVLFELGLQVRLPKSGIFPGLSI